MLTQNETDIVRRKLCAKNGDTKIYIGFKMKNRNKSSIFNFVCR